jgi:hypothetical protein
VVTNILDEPATYVFRVEVSMASKWMGYIGRVEVSGYQNKNARDAGGGEGDRALYRPKKAEKRRKHLSGPVHSKAPYKTACHIHITL